MVTLEDVIEICEILSSNAIQFWLTGGWGIDTLLGRQTRQHKDLDILVLQEDVFRMRELLIDVGYTQNYLWPENRWTTDRPGNKIPTAFVLHDSEGREIDVHAMNLDDQNNGISAWEEVVPFVFTEQHLSGTGIINRYRIQCITADSQMVCHNGYDLPEKQIEDLRQLHEKFGVDYPENYIQKVKRNQKLVNQAES